MPIATPSPMPTLPPGRRREVGRLWAPHEDGGPSNRPRPDGPPESGRGIGGCCSTSRSASDHERDLEPGQTITPRVQQPLTTTDWGTRSVLLAGPAGTVIDLFNQTEDDMA